MDNFSLYLLSLFITSILFIPIIRKIYSSIIDPLLYVIFVTIFADSIPIFLYLINEINLSYLGYFVIAEFLFWFGFLWGIRMPSISKTWVIINEYKISNKIYFAFFLTLFILTISVYLFWGIPAFMPSRFDLFAGAGGWGFISRLTPFLTTFCTFYSYYIIGNNFNRLWKNCAFFVLLCIIVFGILSGSRSSLFNLVFTYFGYCFFYANIMPNKKIVRKLIILTIIGVLYVFSFSAVGNGLGPTIVSFAYRMVANGDIYWLTLPNGIIDQVNPSPWYVELFSGFIYPLRLADPANYNAAIGAQAVWLNFPGLEGANIGANTRPPIFCYVHFQWWGIWTSFFCGLFISLMIKILPKLFPKGIIGAVLSFSIYIQIIACITDPTIGVTFIFEFLVGLFYLMFIILGFGLMINFVKHNMVDSRI